jgi:carboxyl-terminal processing protease
VNGRSASASEIVAAALQDQDRALLIGSASFGKGTVQTVIPLPNKGELILTWSRFITPSGYFLNGLGVPPFICTSLLSGSVSEMVDATVSNAPNLARMIEQWRMPAPRADDEKKRLKSICPATDLRPDRDAKLAEYLIGNRHAYQRIMSLSPAIASAIN